MAGKAAAHISRRKWATVVVALASAAGLLYLSIPRTVAAFFALPGDSVFERVQRGEAVSLEDVRTLATSRQRAVLWADWPSEWSDLGYAEHEIAYRERGPDGRLDPKLLDRAVAATEHALAHAPLESEAWGRLALLRYVMAGPDAAASAADALSALRFISASFRALIRLSSASSSKNGPTACSSPKYFVARPDAAPQGRRADGR